ncbi:MAG TPA: twin-arginine translocation signal domain-containing protein [Methylomirabilota bacterium]|nr:twin-arginine translocation signal domain-containing protein [Methylomirabilota bacterium]
MGKRKRSKREPSTDSTVVVVVVKERRRFLKTIATAVVTAVVGKGTEGLWSWRSAPIPTRGRISFAEFEVPSRVGQVVQILPAFEIDEALPITPVKSSDALVRAGV